MGISPFGGKLNGFSHLYFRGSHVCCRSKSAVYLRSLSKDLLTLLCHVDMFYVYIALFFSSQGNFTNRTKNNCAVVSDVRNDAIPKRLERCS